MSNYTAITSSVSFYLPTHERLERYLKGKESTRSAFINKAIREALDREDENRIDLILNSLDEKGLKKLQTKLNKKGSL